MDTGELEAYESYTRDESHGWGILRNSRWGSERDVDLVHVTGAGWHSTTMSAGSLRALYAVLTAYLNAPGDRGRNTDCEECGAWSPEGADVMGTWHASTCSLNTDNVVG